MYLAQQLLLPVASKAYLHVQARSRLGLAVESRRRLLAPRRHHHVPPFFEEGLNHALAWDRDETRTPLSKLNAIKENKTRRENSTQERGACGM